MPRVLLLLPLFAMVVVGAAALDLLGVPTTSALGPTLRSWWPLTLVLWGVLELIAFVLDRDARRSS